VELHCQLKEEVMRHEYADVSEHQSSDNERAGVNERPSRFFVKAFIRCSPFLFELLVS
jgi:hypothetical protein